MILSRAQIRSLALLAGFPAQDIPTAVAVALAESGGNTAAYNPETAANAPVTLGSYGLWQIFKWDHPEFSVDELQAPLTNAFAAYRVYEKAGGSFEPWSTFKGGAFKKYLEVDEDAGADLAKKIP